MRCVTRKAPATFIDASPTAPPRGSNRVRLGRPGGEDGADDDHAGDGFGHAHERVCSAGSRSRSRGSATTARTKTTRLMTVGSVVPVMSALLHDFTVDADQASAMNLVGAVELQLAVWDRPGGREVEQVPRVERARAGRAMPAGSRSRRAHAVLHHDPVLSVSGQLPPCSCTSAKATHHPASSADAPL